ncbi:MAG: EAL domain-containing protein, partial [Alphaproteobacteria bacterium]
LVGKTLAESAPFKGAMASVAALDGLEAKGSLRYERLPLETRDGRKVDVEFIATLCEAGQARLIQCSIRDITEWTRAIAEVARRELMLRAVMARASELLHSRELDRIMPQVLAHLGGAIGIERVCLFENGRDADVRLVARQRFEWRAPRVPALADEPFWRALDLDVIGQGSWRAALAKGEIVAARVPQVEGSLRQALEAAGIGSLLAVSIVADGTWWGEIVCTSGDGERRWSGSEIDVLKTVADLIGVWLARRRTRRELEHADRIAANSPTVLLSVAPEEKWPLTYVSRNIARYGYDARVLMAASASCEELIHPDDRAALVEDSRRIFGGTSNGLRRECRVRTADGSYRWTETRMSAVRAPDGQLTALDGTFTDVDDRRRIEDKMSELARTDGLTGLANRASFVDRLNQAFSAAKRGGAPFAVLYLDLDRFKEVNDTLGHPVGDLLLQAVAGRLTNLVRGADIVARFGGDEFAILQVGVSDPEGAGALSAKIEQEISLPFDIGGGQVQITVSIGIAIFAAGTQRPADMIAQADLALYRAKEEGRNQYRFHSKNLDELVRERIILANELRSGIARNELELHYQPQVELASGRIYGMEALVRWNHPRRGQLMPSVFVPVAERTGGIQPLGDWVLGEALRQFGRWRAQGIAPSVIAVNLSAAQFKIRAEFDETVAEDIKSVGIDPSDVELELTEAALMETVRARGTSLGRLRDLGLRIAIDDFGTGYSSLEYLRDNRVTRLKIAPQYVRDMMTDPGSATIVRATIGLARELGIETVAQGVEAENQRVFLENAGCQYIQGYYFSAPVPQARATELLLHRTIEPAKARQNGGNGSIGEHRQA